MGHPTVLVHILKKGVIGEDVRLLQGRFNELSYGMLSEDGIFGPRTEDSVRRFQMDNHGPRGRKLAVDGIVGPLTWWAFFNGCDGEEPCTSEIIVKGSNLMQSALGVARIELGHNVREIPPRSNRGPDVEKYLASVGRNQGDAWCAAFVYWCVEQAARELGLSNPLKRTGRVASMWHYAVETGCALPVAAVRSGEEGIPPGAIFCAVYNSGRGHMGFVGSRDGDILHTIEGNTNTKGSSEGDGVYSRRRSLSRYKAIKGFIIY